MDNGEGYSFFLRLTINEDEQRRWEGWRDLKRISPIIENTAGKDDSCKGIERDGGWKTANPKVHGSSGTIRRVTGRKFKVHCADEVVGHGAGCASNFRVSLSADTFANVSRPEGKGKREGEK